MVHRRRTVPGRWVLAATLLVAALLVAGSAAVAARGGDAPASGGFTAPFGDGRISVEFDPATVGSNRIHAYVSDRDGRLRPVSEPALSLVRDGERHAGDLAVAGTGHLLGVRQLPAAGAYDVVVEATVDDATRRAQGTVNVAASERGVAGRFVEWCSLQFARVRN